MGESRENMRKLSTRSSTCTMSWWVSIKKSFVWGVLRKTYRSSFALARVIWQSSPDGVRNSHQISSKVSAYAFCCHRCLRVQTALCNLGRSPRSFPSRLLRTPRCPAVWPRQPRSPWVRVHDATAEEAASAPLGGSTTTAKSRDRGSSLGRADAPRSPTWALRPKRHHSAHPAPMFFLTFVLTFG